MYVFYILFINSLILEFSCVLKEAKPHSKVLISAHNVLEDIDPLHAIRGREESEDDKVVVTRAHFEVAKVFLPRIHVQSDVISKGLTGLDFTVVDFADVPLGELVEPTPMVVEEYVVLAYRQIQLLPYTHKPQHGIFLA